MNAALSSPRRRALAGWLGSAFALAAGLAVAWVDTRATWDDAGITATALFAASAIAATLGARVWVAALLVAGPLYVFEWGALGAMLPVPALVALAGAGLGALVRRSASSRR
jgi:hypothetical protein